MNTPLEQTKQEKLDAILDQTAISTPLFSQHPVRDAIAAGTFLGITALTTLPGVTSGLQYALKMALSSEYSLGNLDPATQKVITTMAAIAFLVSAAVLYSKITNRLLSGTICYWLHHRAKEIVRHLIKTNSISIPAATTALTEIYVRKRDVIFGSTTGAVIVFYILSQTPDLQNLPSTYTLIAQTLIPLSLMISLLSKTKENASYVAEGTTIGLFVLGISTCGYLGVTSASAPIGVSLALLALATSAYFALREFTQWSLPLDLKKGARAAVQYHNKGTNLATTLINKLVEKTGQKVVLFPLSEQSYREEILDNSTDPQETIYSREYSRESALQIIVGLKNSAKLDINITEQHQEGKYKFKATKAPIPIPFKVEVIPGPLGESVEVTFLTPLSTQSDQ